MRTGHSRGEKTCIDVQSGDVGCWGHRVDREEDRAVAPTMRWGQQSLPVRLSLSPFSSLLGWFLFRAHLHGRIDPSGSGSSVWTGLMGAVLWPPGLGRLFSPARPVRLQTIQVSLRIEINLCICWDRGCVWVQGVHAGRRAWSNCVGCEFRILSVQRGQDAFAGAVTIL